MKLKNGCYYLTVLWITLCLIATSGCQKAPIDSRVEGFWMLKSFTIRESNETVICHRLYYSIGRMVTEVSERQGTQGYAAYIGRTEYGDNGKKLILRDFKTRGDTTSDTGQDAPITGLLPYGICSQKETVFQILHCNGKTMTLKSDYAQLELEKF